MPLNDFTPSILPTADQRLPSRDTPASWPARINRRFVAWKTGTAAAAIWLAVTALVVSPLPEATGAAAPVRLALLLLLGGVVWWALRASARGVHAHHQQQTAYLHRLATTDELTGLANRRAFLQRLASEVERARRYQRGLAVVMIDLDGLKQINDQYGHAAGDDALRSIATALGDSSRDSDLAARLGGDEFALILPEGDTARAEALIERLRQTLAEFGVPQRAASAGAPLSFSAGIAELHDGMLGATQLLDAADGALYGDKRRASGTDAPPRAYLEFQPARQTHGHYATRTGSTVLTSRRAALYAIDA